MYLYIGICTQQDLLFPLLTVEEHLHLYLRLKRTPIADVPSHISTLLTSFLLEHRRHHRGTELSGGEKRKLSVAIAMCGDSKFIVLDEPTAGMDVEARHMLWAVLKGIQRDRTILLTTHYMVSQMLNPVYRTVFHTLFLYAFVTST